jgi:lytic cellulose monooxygenase (C1-hydroxylating)
MVLHVPNPNRYLLRAEMLALHEGDAIFTENPIRGAQFYPNCVQLEVKGDGVVELPKGVSFPGAYKYDDPGVHHDVRPPVHLNLFKRK